MIFLLLLNGWCMAFKTTSYEWVGLYHLHKTALFWQLSLFTCVQEPPVTVSPILFMLLYVLQRNKNKSTFLYKVMNGLAWGQGETNYNTPIWYVSNVTCCLLVLADMFDRNLCCALISTFCGENLKMTPLQGSLLCWYLDYYIIELHKKYQ